MKKLNTRLDEAMSVTLRPSKSQPGSFKVHSVGSKMKAHGGIKPGERVQDHHIDDFHDSGIKVKYHKVNIGTPKSEGFMDTVKKGVDEAIERRADRKTIIATDPSTGRKVLKVAPKKEIEIGKGKIESVEQGKYNPNITLPGVGGPEYKKNLKKSVADLKKTTGKKAGVGEGYKQDFKRKELDYELRHEVGVKKPAAKKPQQSTSTGVDDATRRAFMRSKPPMGRLRREETVSELKISTMQKYKSAAKQDNQTGENARHKGYPEKAIDARQAKRDKGIATADKRIHKKQVKMATGIPFDKRYKGSNYSGAHRKIEKIRPGLADHPKVASALKRANEEFKQDGNMTGASKAIDKIKPGLSDHPKVKAALQRANEEFKLGE